MNLMFSCSLDPAVLCSRCSLVFKTVISSEMFCWFLSSKHSICDHREEEVTEVKLSLLLFLLSLTTNMKKGFVVYVLRHRHKLDG